MWRNGCEVEGLGASAASCMGCLWVPAGWHQRRCLTGAEQLPIVTQPARGGQRVLCYRTVSTRKNTAGHAADRLPSMSSGRLPANPSAELQRNSSASCTLAPHAALLHFAPAPPAPWRAQPGATHRLGSSHAGVAARASDRRTASCVCMYSWQAHSSEGPGCQAVHLSQLLRRLC